MKKLLVIVVMLLSLAAPTSTQTPSSVFIEDDVDAGDRVGQDVVYALRQAVRNTSFYRLADRPKGADYTLSLLSDARKGCSFSIFSVALIHTANDQLLTHSVMSVAENDVDGMAKQLWGKMHLEVVKYEARFK